MEKKIKINQSEIRQSALFIEGEGDNWYQRNKASLQSNSEYFEVETVKRVLKSFNGRINSILEIGSCSGIKLNDLCKFFNATGYGIDPSIIAVKEGNKLYENIKLIVSTADILPFNNYEFDLVFFGFCLYLVDRADIYKAVAEADRVLKSGGFLAILDFDPKIRHKNTYHHKSAISSYKADYSTFFTANGHYHLVAKESFSHTHNHFSEDSNERISITILYKEPQPY